MTGPWIPVPADPLILTAAVSLHSPDRVLELPAAMADNRRKSTAEGKRPMADSGATEEEEVKKGCDVCHGPLKPPVYQLDESRVACSDCGADQRRSFADLAENAINVVSRQLGYFKVPCPNEIYGCGGVASRNAASHAAVCAHAPYACPECPFIGSSAQLVGHLTDPAGPHGWPATEITYGKFFPFVVNMPKERQHCKYYLFVVEEDKGVFLLTVGHEQEPDFGYLRVVCLRGNAGAGPVYRSCVIVNRGFEESCMVKMVVRSCLAPRDVCPFWLQGLTKLHMRIGIDRMT